jgi:Helix-turn-helix domain
VVIRWAGGQHSALSVRKQRTGEHRYATSRDVVALVRDLVHVLPDSQIAGVLNRLGYRTGRGNAWTSSRVVTLRHSHQIPVHDPASAARDGWLTLETAAAELQVSRTVVRKLIRRGVLPAKQLVPTAPWMIQAADLALDGVQHYVAAVRKGKHWPRIDDAAQLTLTDSAT